MVSLCQHHNEPVAFVLGERQGQHIPGSGPVGGMLPNIVVGIGAGAEVGVAVGSQLAANPDDHTTKLRDGGARVS